MKNKAVNYESLRCTMWMFRSYLMRTQGLIDVVDDDNYNEIMRLIDKAEEYRWHDLRKNPEDLPDMIHNVLFAWIDNVGGQHVSEGVYNYGDWVEFRWSAAITKKTVIAWREIEPFGEEMQDE